MTNQEKDRIESAIRHIESSLDVDPWACEIAVNAMRAQLSEAPPDLSEYSDKLWKAAYERGREEAVIRCKDCKYLGSHGLCGFWDDYISNVNYYCGCAERREDG